MLKQLHDSDTNWHFSAALVHNLSGLQGGPAERGRVKKRQKPSKSVKKFFDTFRQFPKSSKIVKKRQKVFRHFSKFFFRAEPFFRPLLGGSDLNQRVEKRSKTSQKQPFFDFFNLLSTFFQAFLTLGPRGPGDLFSTFFGFRARRARMTPVRGQGGCNA